MKNQSLIALALCWAAPAFATTENDIPAACKNLALMQAQMLDTSFDTGVMGNGAVNPSHLVLHSKTSYFIAKVEDLGGDGDGSLPCDKENDLCTNPAGAGGAIGWDKLTISNKQGKDAFPVGEIVISVGSRGGCTISSAKHF